MLYIFGGLPASGKTTLARNLARLTAAVYVRIDSIEEAIVEAGNLIGPEGYEAAYRIAADNLDNGLSVVADCVNPIQTTRSAWRKVAVDHSSEYREIEVICSDQAEHRRRLESRIGGVRKLTWDDVLNREYEPWDGSFVFDTSGELPEKSWQRFKHVFSLDDEAA